MHKTKFNKLAEKLGLKEGDWESSGELKAFAKQFRDVYYVPEELLKKWGIVTIYDKEIETKGRGR